MDNKRILIVEDDPNLGKILNEFLSAKLKGTGKQNDLGEDKELVWDIDNSNFRIYNYATTVGEVVKHSDIKKEKLAS